jgi:hypothetical protein
MLTLSFEVVANRAKFSKKCKYVNLEFEVIHRATYRVVKKLVNRAIEKVERKLESQVQNDDLY